MSLANPFWGAPRIHGELLKFGIAVGQTTVAKYMARRRRPPSQGWKTTLRRECLDHIIVFAEAHLRQILFAHAAYYNQARTHLALHKDVRVKRAIQRFGR